MGAIVDPPVTERRETVIAKTEPTSPGSLLPTLGGILAPATLLVALAYYFGWVRTNSLFNYFGIDTSSLGFSTQDYVLRSIDPLFRPAIAMAIAGSLFLWFHALTRQAIAKEQHLHWIRGAGQALLLLGAPLLALGLVALMWGVPGWIPYLLPPASPGLAAFFLGYGAYLITNARGQRHAAQVSHQSHVALPTPGIFVFLSVLVFLSLFWTVAVYASAVGRQQASAIASQLSHRPDAIIYSRDRLFVEAPGVVEFSLGSADSAYRFKYAGFKLLIHSGSRYFLLPSQWKHAGGAAIVLPDTDSIRLEFITAGP